VPISQFKETDVVVTCAHCGSMILAEEIGGHIYGRPWCNFCLEPHDPPPVGTRQVYRQQMKRGKTGG